MDQTLIDLAAGEFDIDLALAYATPDNFTGKPVYRRPGAYLHRDAALHLDRAIVLAKSAGLRVRVFDAFRPSQAQWVLWEHTPDPDFLADPRKGSPHSRGVALDLTLLDAAGQPLDMGTGFDDFSARAHHGNTDITGQAQRNRMMLLGIMTAAGWDHYLKEWWHYQLFDSRRYTLLGDDALDEPMM
ncbi:MAG: D-alanyl-D-alanine dipeptidase [Alphaproteobacteria bacterium]